MIEKPSKELTLVIYNSPKPPKYLKINKKILRTLLFLLSAVLFISIFVSVLTSVYSQKKLENIKNKEPIKIRTLEEEKIKLQKKIFLLEQTEDELTQKISMGASNTDTTLSLFSQPLGYENLIDKKLAKINNITMQEKDKKIIFKFDLLNDSQDSDRLSGYISIIQYSEDAMSFYPKLAILGENLVLDYSSGESFFISKFRPVVAEFDKTANQKFAQYKIFIFSRTGNLLAFETTDKFTLK